MRGGTVGFTLFRRLPQKGSLPKASHLHEPLCSLNRSEFGGIRRGCQDSIRGQTLKLDLIYKIWEKAELVFPAYILISIVIGL